MQLTELKSYITSCPDLAGLDDASMAFIMWRGEEVKLGPGAILYAQGAPLDDTFCLLMSGELVVEINGARIGRVQEKHVLGEMAYFIHQQVRTATIRAGSLGASVLKIGLTPSELAASQFIGLKKYLGAQAWDRFVSNSQRAV